MVWTPEMDAQLTELHRKRLSLAFITTWMRWPAPAVRARLVELGLVKKPSPKAASLLARTASRSIEQCDIAEPTDRGEDEDEDLRAAPGCPAGHLMPEARIAELYQSTGRNYR